MLLREADNILELYGLGRWCISRATDKLEDNVEDYAALGSLF